MNFPVGDEFCPLVATAADDPFSLSLYVTLVFPNLSLLQLKAMVLLLRVAFPWLSAVNVGCRGRTEMRKKGREGSRIRLVRQACLIAIKELITLCLIRVKKSEPSLRAFQQLWFGPNEAWISRADFCHNTKELKLTYLSRRALSSCLMGRSQWWLDKYIARR